MYGDKNPGDSIVFYFNTVSQSNAPITLVGGTVSVYKDGGATESTAGVTLSTDFDGKTGHHKVVITTASDGTFYSAGSDFEAFLSAGTVDGVDYTGFGLEQFSIQNRQTTVRSVLSGAIVAGSFAANALDAVWSTASRTLTAFAFSVTVGTNNDKTGYSLSSAGIQAVWDALTSALTTAGSVGKLLVDNLNATVSSRLASASYTAPDNSTISSINTSLTGSQSEPGQGVPAANASPLTKLSYLYKFLRNKHEQTSTEFKLYADDAVTVDQKAAVSDDGTTFSRGEVQAGP